LGFVRKVRVILVTLGAAALLAAIQAAPSGAAITIGADLSTPATQPNSCSNQTGDPFGCTWFNTTVPGRTVTSPIDGVIVTWRIHPEDGSDAQDVRLRIIRPAGGNTHESGGASTAHPISTTQALQVFPTRLPVHTGDHIGLDQGNGSKDASISRENFTAGFRIFNPRLPDSGATSSNPAPGEGGELVLNADIEADADKDGFGDETQDQCPTDASTQGPCPGPQPGPSPTAAAEECVRREISLVSAAVRGAFVLLRGLVQPRFAGQPVAILANTRPAGRSALTRLATVRSNAAGEYTARVRRPRTEDLKKTRYRAQVDRFRSIPLKLPQSLSSSSVKVVGGQIELRGRVKRAVLGRRNPVVIKRLVCGRYRTVGQAKPDRNGNYVARFSVPANVTVALFRAETRVLNKPGGRRYAKEYARAISITLTNQTG
jgi:hypothetical protein